MAILCGGDYDKVSHFNPFFFSLSWFLFKSKPKVGLDGCGWKTVHLLTQSELATSIFIAASNLTSWSGLVNFLCDWWKKLHTLLAFDPQNILGRRYPSLAKNITDNFPSVDLILQYAQPLTSWTMDQMLNTASWQCRQPNLTEIVALCEKFFSWDHQEILSHGLRTCYGQELLFNTFCRYEINHVTIQFVWTDTILIQHPTVDENLAQYASEDIIPGPKWLTTHIHVLQICQARLGPGAYSTHPDVIGYTIQISTHGVIHDTALGLDSNSRLLTLAQVSDCPKTSFWIPGSVLSVTFPELVKWFTGKKAILPLEKYSPVCHYIFFLIHAINQVPTGSFFFSWTSTARRLRWKADQHNLRRFSCKPNHHQLWRPRIELGSRPNPRVHSRVISGPFIWDTLIYGLCLCLSLVILNFLASIMILVTFVQKSSCKLRWDKVQIRVTSESLQLLLLFFPLLTLSNLFYDAPSYTNLKSQDKKL